MRPRGFYQLTLFLLLTGALAWLSLVLFPPLASMEVWSPVARQATLEWDTGYGLNGIQSAVIPAGAARVTYRLGGRDLYLVRVFRRLNLPERLRLSSHGGAPDIYYGVHGKLRKADCVPSGVAESCQTGSLDWEPLRRTGWNRIEFWLGISFLAALLTAFSVFAATNALAARAGDECSRALLALFLFFSAALALVFFFSWPGLQNPFDPLSMLMGTTGLDRFDHPYFRLDHAPLLQFFWACLYEAFPSYCLLSLAEVGLYFLALLSLAKGLWSVGWRETRLVTLFLLLLLSPVAVCGELFVERSVVSAHAVLVLSIYTYLLLRRRSGGIRSTVIFSALLALGMALRMDNIPIVLVLAAGVGLRLSARRRWALGATLALAFYGFFVALPLSFDAPPGWSHRYLVESTILSMADLVRHDPGILAKNDREKIVDGAVRVEELKENLPHGSNHADRSSPDPSAVDAYLEIFRQCVLEMPGTFLSFRWSFFLQTLVSPGMWTMESLGPLGPGFLLPLDMRILPPDFFVRPGASIGSILNSYLLLGPARYLFTTALGLGLLISLVLAGLGRADSLLALAVLCRFPFVFFLAPEPTGFYLIDAYLVSCFLVVARGRWVCRMMLSTGRRLRRGVGPSADFPGKREIPPADK